MKLTLLEILQKIEEYIENEIGYIELFNLCPIAIKVIIPNYIEIFGKSTHDLAEDQSFMEEEIGKEFVDWIIEIGKKYYPDYESGYSWNVSYEVRMKELRKKIRELKNNNAINK